MSVPQDRETICACCERWVMHARVTYLMQDQMNTQHAYPLCPGCQSLGVGIEMWLLMRGQRDPAITLAAMRAVLAVADGEDLPVTPASMSLRAVRHLGGK